MVSSEVISRPIWQTSYAQVEAAFKGFTSPTELTLRPSRKKRSLGGHRVEGRRPYHQSGRTYIVEGRSVHIPHEGIPVTSTFDTQEQYQLAQAAVNTVLSGVLRGDARWYEPTINFINKRKVPHFEPMSLSERVQHRIKKQKGRKDVVKAVVDAVVEAVSISQKLYPNLAIATSNAMSFAGIGGLRIGIRYTRKGGINPETGQVVWPLESLPMTAYEGLHDVDGLSIPYEVSAGEETLEATSAYMCNGTASGPELIRQIADVMHQLPKELQNTYRLLPDDPRYTTVDMPQELRLESKLKLVTIRNARAARRMYRRGELA